MKEVSTGELPAVRLRRFQRIPPYVINLSIILLFLIALFWILFAISLGMLAPGW